MKHKYLLGLFDDEEILLTATEKIRSAGYQMHEIYTPFPVHGLDKAMGLQDSRLHTFGFICGATGTLFALSMMSLIAAVDWPIIVGGKQFLAFPAYVPITFEVTVLFASIGMTVAMYLRCGFSVFTDTEVVDLRATDDRFVMAFCEKRYSEADDQNKIVDLLKQHGAVEIKERGLDNEIQPNLFVMDEDDHGHDHGHGHH